MSRLDWQLVQNGDHIHVEIRMAAVPQTNSPVTDLSRLIGMTLRKKAENMEKLGKAKAGTRSDVCGRQTEGEAESEVVLG